LAEIGRVEMPVDKKDLFLIDGYALIYRAYFAFIKSQLSTRSGEKTGAIFGFTSFLLRILDRYIPQYWAVVLDTQEPTFRHKLFPDYKATREKMPEELQDQLPRIREILLALRIPVLELEGYEADDIIGTLSRKGVKKGLRVVIVSGDKDFYQLVGDDVILLNPGKRNRADDWMDVKGVVEKLGVPPDKIIDLLALMGDSSDNVPGVPGIGRKTAEKLIKEFGGLSELYESIQSVSSDRMRDKLEKHQEAAFLSRELVTLDADIPVEVPLESLKRVEPDSEKVDQLFSDLEFHSLMRHRTEGVKVEEKGEYRVISSYQALETILKKATDSGRLGLDAETTALDPMEAELVGISLSVNEGEAYYIPLAHVGEKSLDKDRVLDALRPVFESRDIKKVGQNLKYDLVVLKKAGIELNGLSFDTMIASYLLEPVRKSHSLDFLAKEFLGLQMKSFSEVVDDGKTTFADVSIKEAMEYSCEDIDYTMRLASLFKGKLEEKRLYPLFRDVEIPLISVLAEMEMAGVTIDKKFFDDLSRRLGCDLKHLEDDIFKLAGEEFNINSHQQLSRILFEKLKLPKQKKTKTGYSTDSEVLARLVDRHEIPRLLLDYRELAKLSNTYVNALPAQVNLHTNRIHTSYNQVVTSTGRLSSSRPNLQNIPVRTTIGREIRKGFIPKDEDHLILSCDYSQIELRIMAHLSRDEEMIRAFEAGEDIHRQTASLVFDIPYEKVPEMLRSRAKEVNFGIIYGMGAFGLSRRLDIPVEEANAFIDDYFIRFSGVKSFIDNLISEAKERGYVTTIMGRRRYLPDIDDSRRSVREFAQRTAINSPIQGSAADIIKIAMIDIHRELRRRKLRSQMIIQVHDELVLEVPKDELDEIRVMVMEKMEQAIVLRVPVIVDVKTGSNWLECKSGS
jgi:DNA polymerase-1